MVHNKAVLRVDRIQDQKAENEQVESGVTYLPANLASKAIFVESSSQCGDSSSIDLFVARGAYDGGSKTRLAVRHAISGYKRSTWEWLFASGTDEALFMEVLSKSRHAVTKNILSTTTTYHIVSGG